MKKGLYLITVGSCVLMSLTLIVFSKWGALDKGDQYNCCKLISETDFKKQYIDKDGAQEFNCHLDSKFITKCQDTKDSTRCFNLLSEGFSFHTPLVYLYNYLLFEVFFLGSLFFFGLFIFVQYLHYRDETYLLYLGYLIISFSYFLRDFRFEYDFNLLYSLMPLSYQGELFLSAGIIISYTLFIIAFLNVHKNRGEKLNIAYKLILLACMAAACMDLIIGLWNPIQDDLSQLEIYAKAGILFLVAFALYEAFKLADKRLVQYVIAGALCLFIGAFLTGIIRLVDHFSNAGTTPPIIKSFYFKLGTFAQIVCFTIGLGYKTKIKQENTLKKIKEQGEIEKDLIETRLEALKANLSRHFIFNSLTSAKYCIQNKEYEKAINYIAAFSSLLRETLKLSNHRVIPLTLELEYCRKYLNIERRRLDGKFDYSIIESSEIDASFFMIPPLVLQPLLENAIIHGVIPLEDRVGKIAIHTEVEGNNFLLHIEDNGIGIKDNWKRRTDSFGLEFAIKLLANQKIKMSIANKKDLPKAIGKGTIITLIFKP